VGAPLATNTAARATRVPLDVGARLLARAPGGSLCPVGATHQAIARRIHPLLPNDHAAAALTEPGAAGNERDAG
jgi:hypothetical protein